MNDEHMTNSLIFPHPLFSSLINSQQMQQCNIQSLQSRINELQMQQTCCNQAQSLDMRIAQMQNYIQAPAYIPRINPVYQEKDQDLIEALDKILFPEDPIRDYCEKLVSEIENKYDKILKEFDRLIEKGK